MHEYKKAHLSTRKGFTLIELLVVIAIIGILATIVITMVDSAHVKAQIAAGQAFDASTYNAIGDQIVAEWDFDEGSGSIAKDATGNGNIGTIIGGSYTTGMYNTALSFNGNSTYVNVPKNPALTPASMTVGAWINSNNTALQQVIVSKAYGTGGWYLDIEGSKLNLMAANNNNVTGQTTLNSNQWYYVAGSYDGTTLKVYVNGKLDGTKAVSNSTNDTNLPLYIGQYSGAWFGSYFDGLIDEVRIYSKVL